MYNIATNVIYCKGNIWRTITITECILHHKKLLNKKTERNQCFASHAGGYGDVWPTYLNKIGLFDSIMATTLWKKAVGEMEYFGVHVMHFRPQGPWPLTQWH